MAEATDDATYSLFFRDTEGGMIFRYKYEGVTLHADRMTWTAESASEARYATIASIALTVGYIARSGPIANCRILFNNLSTLSVTSANAFGTNDDARAETYRTFVADLHRRLSSDDRKRIDFRAGSSAGRQTAGYVILVIAAAFFVALPLVLFFITGEWKALGLLLAGGALVWPLWNVLNRNRPRAYDPNAVDEDLLP